MRKIRLFCAAGMSTSLLVTKMQNYAKEIGYDCEVAAYPISEAATYGPEADIILLGPQVRFQKKDIEKMIKERPNGVIPCEVIDMRDYGTMNGKAVFDFAMKLLGK